MLEAALLLLLVAAVLDETPVTELELLLEPHASSAAAARPAAAPVSAVRRVI